MANPVANALLEIRDSRLYRQQFPTFEAYCRERWGFERRQAYRLIDAAAAVNNVSNWTQTVPQTESQARPLTRLEPEVQREVWKEVIAETTHEEITARVVEEKANSTARQFPQLGKSTKPGAVATAENLLKPTRRSTRARAQGGQCV